jgi:NADP-dependent 3-hydroxy acid dehydrogenase YdfG
MLAGRVVAITGGARGIGKATALAFVREGMKVAIGDVDADLARRSAEELGGGTVAFALDVTDRASFESFVSDAEDAHGPLDVLVNNAGIMPIAHFLDEDDVTAQRMIDINCHGVLHGMKVALPRFVARDRGHLVNIASTAGKGGFPGGATYCGTKHFVVGVSEAVRAELLETGVEVSCVMPAIVNTELSTGLVQARGVKAVEPEDVADAIVEALRSPRFDVFVPKSVGPINKVMGLLPRRGRESIARLLKIDRILFDADQSARRGYELRAARSEPGLEAGDEQKQLTESAGS